MCACSLSLPYILSFLLSVLVIERAHRYELYGNRDCAKHKKVLVLSMRTNISLLSSKKIRDSPCHYIQGISRILGQYYESRFRTVLNNTLTSSG